MSQKILYKSNKNLSTSGCLQVPPSYLKYLADRRTSVPSVADVINNFDYTRIQSEWGLHLKHLFKDWPWCLQVVIMIEDTRVQKRRGCVHVASRSDEILCCGEWVFEWSVKSRIASIKMSFTETRGRL